MLLRTTDPFREFDRLANQLLGTTNRPVVMPMDAWRAFTQDRPGFLVALTSVYWREAWKYG